MPSLEEHLDTLKADLLCDPIRISAYHDLPFALFCYDPHKEFNFRKQIRLMAIDIEQNHHRRVIFISLGELLWHVIKNTEGIDAVAGDELQRGFDASQQTIYSLLSDEDFMPLHRVILQRIKDLDPGKDIIFMVRAGALAPALYRGSSLLDRLHGNTMIPVVLFYGGTLEGSTDIRFMNMEHRAHMGIYNYRVKIYGGN